MKIRTVADEIVPLAQRVQYLRLFRFALVLGVVLFASYAPNVVRADPFVVAVGSGVFILATFAAEIVWRATGRRSLLLFAFMLMVDGAYLAWLAYVTGGPTSRLLNLILLHLVAVTLLASYRTGLKLAMWHSLLLLVVYYAQAAGMVAPGMSAPPRFDPAAFQHLIGFISVYWLAALATSTMSAVNERELRRRRYDLEALAQLAASLEGTAEARDVGGVLLGSLLETFGFERGVVLAKLGQEVSVIAAKRSTVRSDRPFSGEDDLMLRAWEGRKTVLVTGLDPDANPTLAALLPDARNLVLVPMTAEGGSVGLVVVEHGLRLGGRIERRVVSMMERFTSQAALALRNASLLEQLREMADTDGLTGLFNRRTFDTALDVELRRASRADEPVSLVLFDLDKFKQLNDTHGHRTGDEVLRQVARTIQENSRSYDLPARYGGEEFALILPGSDATRAVDTAERIRRAIGTIQGPIGVTCSAGVATFPLHAADTDTLVKTADAALYRSKREGRDRTTLAAPTLADRSEAWVAGQPTPSGATVGEGAAPSGDEPGEASR
jgi:diguanylate cyclase (GGDEF)-like protein